MNTFVGMKNGGATCYMNAILQQLFMQPSIRKLLLSVPEVGAPEENIDNIFYQMQTMFANLALTKKDFHIPRAFWTAFKDYDGTRLNLREHQDAYEFFTRLQVSPIHICGCCQLLYHKQSLIVEGPHHFYTICWWIVALFALFA